MKKKEYYFRHSICIDEQLANQYGKMRKCEILLHQYILSIVDGEGIVKRNMEAAARETGCCKKSLYPAETSLIMLELISITRRNSTRYWKVVERKLDDNSSMLRKDREVRYRHTGHEVEAESLLVDDVPVFSDDEVVEMIDDAKPKRRFLSWLRGLL